MNQKSKSSFLIVLLALALILIYTTTMMPTHLTIFSVNQINIDPKGYVEDGKLKGTFWSITLLADFSEDVGAYEFDDSEAHSSGADYYWNGKNVTVQRKITIRIKPGRPYYGRKLTLSSVKITPHAYQNFYSLGFGRDKWIKVEPLYSGHFTFAESDWTIHTPFTVELYVDDVLKDALVDFDTVGGINSITLGSEPETVTITKLGLIGTGYEAPVWEDIVWFNHEYFYLRNEAIDKALRNPYPEGDGVSGPDEWGTVPIEQLFYTYAFYWYANEYNGYIYDRYWKDEGDPFPFTSPGGWIGFSDNHWGWVDKSELLVARYAPVKPVRFPNEEDDWHKSSYCVTEYLEQVIGAQKPTMPSWLPNPADIVVTESNEMRLYLPYSSTNALLNIRINSELADTIIWEPKLGNFKITEFEDFGDVYEEKVWTITIQQIEDIDAAGTIWFSISPEELAVGVNPITIGTGTMSKDELKTFSFKILNLAVLEDTDFSITAKVTNSMGVTTDEATIYGTAKARSEVTTQLVVQLIDHSTHKPVTGIMTTVTYDTKSQTEISIDGVAGPFDFGSSSPYVTVTTQETATYQSATASKQLHVGSNSMTIELLKHGETPSSFPWWLTAIIIVVAGAAILISMLKKRKGEI